MRGGQYGYTLVEMMTVLAVTSILTFMATSSFVAFTTKSQAAEAVKVTEGLQQSFRAFYVDNGKTPPLTLVDLQGTGALPKHNMGRYVGSVDLDAGNLVVTYGLQAADALQGTVLTMRPFETGGGGLIWQCGLSPAPVDIDGLPLSVAGTSVGSPVGATLATTTVAQEYLPKECRP